MNSVKECVLIDNHRIELYWDGPVTGSDVVDNLTVLIGNRRVHLHQWNGIEEWDKGCVYEDRKCRTTLYVDENLYPYEAGRIRIIFSDRVQDQTGAPVYSELNDKAYYKPYYEKFSRSNCGILIKSSAEVTDQAHILAARSIDHMLSHMPDVAEVMRHMHAELAIYPKNNDVYEIPEHRYGYKVLHRPVEGFGGVADLPVTSISEVNILRIVDGNHGTRYKNEYILAHEFGHAIHLIGINYCTDQARANALLDAYYHACKHNLWPKTYLISNYEEYYATLSTIWFNVMAESNDGSWDGVRGPVNTREELREYDPEAYKFFSKIYPEEGFGKPWNDNPDYFDINGKRK